MSGVDELGNPIVDVGQGDPPVETLTETPQTDDEKEKLKADLAKAKEVAENYKKEAEKLRQPPKRSLGDKVEPKGQPEHIRNDFLSKREDVYDDVKEELSKLTEEEWQKFKPLALSTVNEALDKAVSENRFVAKGEIQRAVKTVMEFVKDEKTRKSELEQARAEGAREMEKMESAEISGVRTQPAVSDDIEEAHQLAKEKGWSVETAKQILEKRRQRAKDYTPARNY